MFRKGDIPWNKSRKGVCSEETLKKMRKAQMGKNHWNWQGGKSSNGYCLDCGNQTTSPKAIRCRRHYFENNFGKNNPNWKGGVSKKDSYKKWCQKNPDRRRELYMQRRIRENNTIGSHTEAEWMNLKIRYGFMCLCCKKSEPEITLTRDHIIPLVKNGTDNIENIQPLCGQCNCRKFTKIINYIEING